MHDVRDMFVNDECSRVLWRWAPLIDTRRGYVFVSLLIHTITFLDCYDYFISYKITNGCERNEGLYRVMFDVLEYYYQRNKSVEYHR